MISLQVAYDGTNYFGWQKTKSGPSIQEELEKALQKITGSPVPIEACSRTDRGVHARGQVIAFPHAPVRQIPLHNLSRAINAHLPPDIRVYNPLLQEDTFHPTLDAKAKEYRYALSLSPVQNPFDALYAWHIHAPFDRFALAAAALPLLGKRDFAALSNEKTEDAVRTLHSIAFHDTPSGLEIGITGDRFLYKMARNIAGLLVYAAIHKFPPEAIYGYLHSKERKLGAMTAPSHGLFLHKVSYFL